MSRGAAGERAAHARPEIRGRPAARRSGPKLRANPRRDHQDTLSFAPLAHGVRAEQAPAWGGKVMNRLEELLENLRAQTATPDDLAELKQRLSTPEGRAKAREYLWM